MKTIEERAIEWVDSQSAGSVHPHNRQAMVAAYVAVYRELTQWHDLKEVLPKPHKDVLVKYMDGRIEVDFYSPRLGSFFIERATGTKAISWREIH